MCSICPRYSPPDDTLGPYTPITPVELSEETWEKIRRWEFPVGGLICSCPPEDSDE